MNLGSASTSGMCGIESEYMRLASRESLLEGLLKYEIVESAHISHLSGPPDKASFENSGVRLQLINMEKIRRRLRRKKPQETYDEPAPPDVPLAADPPPTSSFPDKGKVLPNASRDPGLRYAPLGPDNLPPLPFPNGVKVSQDCPDATVDICFIHGLTGDRDKTWTAEGESKPWIEILLPPVLPKARILTYGYDADVVRKGGVTNNRLLDHATNFLNDLTTDRRAANASCRPIIFVAHSLGGLVCKEALLSSRNHPEIHLRDVFKYTKGVIFMGTPHKGSWMAKWAMIPATAVGLMKGTNKSLLEVLETNNQFLESIQVRFLAMIREQREGGRPLEITCFYEELHLSAVVKQVVSKESATFDGYSLISIPANHRDMVRFDSTENIGFKRLLGELTRWESELVAKLDETPIKLSQDCQGCLKSLAFPQMESRSLDIDHAIEGTCKWLLGHHTYKRWQDRDQGLLWIKGKPGSGKSTLLKYALSNWRAHPGDLVLSFFFHGRGDELQKTPLGLFRSLLHQVLRQVPASLLDLLDTFNKRCKEFGQPGENWQWHPKEAWHFFESCLLKVLKDRSIWLFVDALDEGGQENAVDLAAKFKSLFQVLSSPGSRFHIFFTCRHYPILDPYCEFEICLEDENTEDISTYVDNQLSVVHALASSTIPALITNRARGVFMWARLVVKQVLDSDRDGKSLETIEEEISLIHQDLDELYQDLIRGMGLASLQLIQWICFATRPLSLDELRWAMAIEADRPCASLKEYWRGEVQTLSCGLAEVIISNDSLSGRSVTKTQAKAKVVQFIHQSVKDFFVDKGLLVLDRSLPLISAAIGAAHYRLSRICIRYLAMKEISQSKSYDWKVFPFLRYAVVSWTLHITECDARGKGQDDLLELFTWPSNDLVELWVHIYRINAEYSKDCPSKGTTLIHVMAGRGVLGPLMTMLQLTDHAREFDAKDMDGRTPLLYAAKNGHEGVIKLLLATGKVDIDLKDMDGRTPLSYAAWNGHEGIVKLLLTTGKVDIDSKGNNGRTPLSYAAGNGYEDIVKLLLAIGKVDIDLKNNYGRTPLSYAAEYGHEGIVKLLLATDKVDIDSKDMDGRTPLSYAAGNSNEGIAKLLFTTGKVDINSKGNNGRTPLSYAAEYGHEGIVKLLLDTGKVDINSKDKYGRTPLSYADFDHEGVIKLLLATGKVDINLKDKYGRTPLLYAAGNGYEGIVKLLLAISEVDINSKDMDGRTPLSYAAWNGHEGIVKLLLATGKVDIDLKDNYGRTPLSYTAGNSHEDTINLLLATCKVDVNSKDMDSQTPLSYAAGNGCEGIVKLLLTIGKVDIDSKDLDRRTPLLYAAKNGHEGVIKLLLTTGKVDIDLKDNNGRILLSYAAENGHEGVIKLLLAIGKVDINLKDLDRRTPLLYAAKNGHEGVIKLLLATGKVDINSKDLGRRTPLLYAAENSHEGVIKLLLATGKVDIDLKDNNSRTLLSYAAENGHEGVIKLLLATGKVDINSKDLGRRTPLLYAAENGHEGVIKLLLATGKVDINSKDLGRRTPLLYAAENGHEGVIKLLLDIGKVDINLKDLGRRTPLLYAAKNGHEGVIKLLLATGKVDINSKDLGRRTPLLYAAENGHEGVIKLLLAIGKVDINSKDLGHRTPLLYAAKNSHEGVIKLLLDTGKVDINSKDLDGRTPLLYAAENGHEGVIKLLLATGKVDINLKDKYGRTLLSYAAGNGYEGIVKLLESYTQS
ncbi:hypothetical protein jhhlp_003395 [Lomentospora prolificans]|uniref:Nephrocystin 3-like N-terminal domain-containing protein n=1 Tax=Lomentospora prolificans TaxID=41688 RepID=A0A2N3N8K9_9PEZI|nr:hypothetical protein jhhlp_003395 [Lomentospora prolificans]